MITIRKELLIFSLILFIGSILRLYRLPETMQFLGDQGRDALIARAILIDHDPAFIGPVTSVGNMYLGPLYYYFMVFPLMLSYPSPVGPAIAVAVIGIITLALIYILGREMIGKRAAMLAMVLYCISPIVVSGVRFSWNPNIVPFFSLILVWAIWKTLHKDYNYWIVAGLCVAALFQLHYIALILIGAIGLIWIYELILQIRQKRIESEFIRGSLLAMIIFGLSLTPLFLFDLKHDWLNFRAFLQFFHPSESGQGHFRKLTDISGIAISFISMLARVIIEFFGITARTLGQKIIICLLFVYLLAKALFQKKDPHAAVARLLTFLFTISVLFLSLYSSSVFDHYLGFVLPITFLLFGVVLSSLSRNVFLTPLVLGVLVVFSIFSIKNYPGFAELGGNIFAFDRSSTEIVKHIPTDGTFTLLSYAPSRDLQAMNYRYFLTTKGAKPTHPDDWTSSRYLVIIDEEHRGNAFDESQYVIKIWPNRQVVNSFSIENGPDVYILER